MHGNLDEWVDHVNPSGTGTFKVCSPVCLFLRRCSSSLSPLSLRHHLSFCFSRLATSRSCRSLIPIHYHRVSLSVYLSRPFHFPVITPGNSLTPSSFQHFRAASSWMRSLTARAVSTAPSHTPNAITTTRWVPAAAFLPVNTQAKKWI